MRLDRVVRAAAAGIACAVPALPAAADDLFAVAGIVVDAEAESAQAAQDVAVAEAGIRAFERMLRKLTLPADHERLPPAEAAALTGLVRGWEVTNERRSERRYIGEFTVRFDAAAVREALRGAGVSHAETRSPPLLVLPVLVGETGANLWEVPHPWRAAWRDLDWRHRLLDLALPYGELADLADISAAQALAGDEARLDAIAQRYDAAGVLVAVARPAAGGESVAVEVAPHRAPVTAPAPAAFHGPEAYLRAAAALAGALERSWIAGNLLGTGGAERLDAIAGLGGLDAWIALRRGLAALGQVERIEVHSLSVAEAAVTLHYLGTRERLQAALAARGLALAADEADRWRIAVGSSPGEPDAGPAPAAASSAAPRRAAESAPPAETPFDDFLVE